MTPFHSISILLLFAALSAWINNRIFKLPSAIGVMIVSLSFSMLLIFFGRLGLFDISFAISFVENFDFEKILLHGMLAFLLFAGALHVEFKDLRSQKDAVAILSTVGVVVSTFLTGYLYWQLLKWIGIGLPFLSALLFGAIASPTDAVAVLGILRKVGVPKSLETTIVGESLFNDGIGVVIFFAASSLAFGKGVSIVGVLASLSIEVFGGIVLGLIIGWMTYRLLKAVDDYVVEVLITLALAAGSYSLAEAAHVSAPICVVVTGLIMGNHGRASAMSPKTLAHVDTFWELVDELLNAVLFVLMGFEILALTIKTEFIFAGLIGIFVVLISRIISVWIPITAMRRWRSFTPHVVKILTWGGLRGGISVALALSLPKSAAHDLLVISTYLVVLFSVLLQGSTLPLVLKFIAKDRATLANTA